MEQFANLWPYWLGACVGIGIIKGILGSIDIDNEAVWGFLAIPTALSGIALVVSIGYILFSK